MSDIQERIEYYKQKKVTQITHPDYYNHSIEVIDFIDSHNLNFSRGNAVKYIVRAGLKDGETEQEALEKAVWYLEREIDRLNAQMTPIFTEEDSDKEIIF